MQMNIASHFPLLTASLYRCNSFLISYVKQPTTLISYNQLVCQLLSPFLLLFFPFTSFSIQPKFIYAYSLTPFVLHLLPFYSRSHTLESVTIVLVFSFLIFFSKNLLLCIIRFTYNMIDKYLKVNYSLKVWCFFFYFLSLMRNHFSFNS